MDHKVMMVNHKRPNKNNNNTKKKGPLRVVYITNPIKFKATASEFRALVQELTGQDSNLPQPRGGEVTQAAEAERNSYVHAVEEGTKEGENGLDPLGSEFCGMDSFEGLMASSSFWNEEGAHDLHDEFQKPISMDAM